MKTKLLRKIKLFIFSSFIFCFLFKNAISEEKENIFFEELKLSSIIKEHVIPNNKNIKNFQLMNNLESFRFKIFSNENEILLNINGKSNETNCGNYALEKYWVSCYKNLINGVISIELYEKDIN